MGININEDFNTEKSMINPTAFLPLSNQALVACGAGFFTFPT